MRIRTCCQLALLLAGTAVATAATAAMAMPSALPASLMRTLPERTAAVTAIEAQPLVLRARGEKAAGLARADGRQRGPHDWIAGGQWQSRDAGRDGRFGEWELSLQRGVRLPAKAGVDRRMAALELEVGADTLADARHVAARGLLQTWTEWLTASELAALARAGVAIAGSDLQATATRLQAGHAAAAEHDAAVAGHASALRLLEQARLREQEARLVLSLRYPQLVLPESPPRIAAPQDERIDWEAWAHRVEVVSHDITLAEGLADLAELRAERARLERHADPSIGVRALNERDGAETVLGVFVSVPLGAGPRQAVANEASALAIAAQADASAVRLETRLQARTLARRAALQALAWQQADAAAQALAQEVEQMERGHALAGVDLADLLATRRRAAEAAMAEIEARATAFLAAASLLLDAHAYWIDEDGHSTGQDHSAAQGQS